MSASATPLPPILRRRHVRYVCRRRCHAAAMPPDSRRRFTFFCRCRDATPHMPADRLPPPFAAAMLYATAILRHYADASCYARCRESAAVLSP